MNKNCLPSIEEYLFSETTYKNNLYSESKTNIYNNSIEVNILPNSTTNYICQNIRPNLNQDKNNSATFPLNNINSESILNHEQNNKFTQKIILHSLHKIKNNGPLDTKEKEKEKENNNTNNNGIQHIKIKTFKKIGNQLNTNNNKFM